MYAGVWAWLGVCAHPSVLLGGVSGPAGWDFPQDVLPGGEVCRGVWAAAAHAGDEGFPSC